MNIGAIFDWDGVIVDSSPYHELAWENLSRELGKPLPPDHFKRGFGMRNENVIPDILEWTGNQQEIQKISLRKEAVFREIICGQDISALSGVELLLKALKDADIPCVIGSSTERLNITTILDKIGLAGYFKEIVSAEDVDKGKPDPQVFLKAAQKIDRPPEACVVFEDTQVGIDAAKAGAMKVVAITNTHPASKLKDADKIVKKLDEISIRDLEGLLL